MKQADAAFSLLRVCLRAVAPSRLPPAPHLPTIALLRVPPPVRPRGDAHDALERAGEVAVIVEPGSLGDVGGLAVGAGQQAAGGVYADAEQVLPGGRAEQPAEVAVELAARQGGDVGEFFG